MKRIATDRSSSASSVTSVAHDLSLPANDRRQNVSRALSCTRRGGAAAVISP
jgi:hypothetical protein